MRNDLDFTISLAIHMLEGGDTSTECRSRVISELRLLMTKIKEANDTCENCGGACVIEPESGDPQLDNEYQCPHGLRIEISVPSVGVM